MTEAFDNQMLQWYNHGWRPTTPNVMVRLRSTTAFSGRLFNMFYIHARCQCHHGKMVLPQALVMIRSLICMVTNTTPLSAAHVSPAREFKDSLCLLGWQKAICVKMLCEILSFLYGLLTFCLTSVNLWWRCVKKFQDWVCCVSYEWSRDQRLRQCTT